MLIFLRRVRTWLAGVLVFCSLHIAAEAQSPDGPWVPSSGSQFPGERVPAALQQPGQPQSAQTAQPAPPKPDTGTSAPNTVEATKEKEEKDKDKTPKPPVPWWERVPVVAKFPRPGDFIITPTGPGYYSLFDLIRDDYREGPPKYPYPRVSPMFPGFFDYSFAYLDKPDNTEHDFFDPVKHCHICDNWIFSTGGEFRFRYNNEVDSRLTNINNRYDLTRLRIYTDFWYQDIARLYVELLDARSFSQDLPPLLTDQDHFDFLNLFVDLKLGNVCDGPVYVRGGRQEMLYGSQRMISTLDWVNTRRTFQGIKTFWRGEKSDIDLFCVQPVFPRTDTLDGPDHTQVFSGLWFSYRPSANQWIDTYYLDLDQAAPIALGRDFLPGSYNVSTVGGRYYSIKDNWLWDVEGAVQFGRWSNQGILAKMGTAGIGYHFKDCCMNPQLWLYYDYASGDPNPGEGNVHRTYNQLFPFGHYYLGFVDVVGRQNINDINAQIAFYPTKWITTFMQYHIFRLDSPKDALYGDNGRIVRWDPTGRAGSDVGEELEIAVNFHLTKHQDIFINYGHLYSGEFIRRTGPPVSPDVLYLQYSYRW